MARLYRKRAKRFGPSKFSRQDADVIESHGPAHATPAQPTLNGQHIRLEPLDEAHREGLRAACDADIEVWNALYPIPMKGRTLMTGGDA